MADLVTIHLRHHHVEDNQIRSLLGNHGQGILAVVGAMDLVPLRSQGHLVKFTEVLVILSDKYFFRIRHTLPLNDLLQCDPFLFVDIELMLYEIDGRPAHLAD